ncbi:MAG: hypothetical protein Cons2KO_19790 [Congregibacter sp.]
MIASLLCIGLALYWLTLDDSQSDPCAALENDTTAAILGDSKDQDALANRAMLQRKLCEKQRESRVDDDL